MISFASTSEFIIPWLAFTVMLLVIFIYTIVMIFRQKTNEIVSAGIEQVVAPVVDGKDKWFADTVVGKLGTQTVADIHRVSPLHHRT